MRRSIAMLFQFLFLITTADFTGAYKLPDSGQTLCYQTVSPYAEIPCTGTGQDGEYDINPMYYTSNGDGTVTDNNTGLMWQAQDYQYQKNWYRAGGTWDSTYNPVTENVCGTETTGGYTDWRLPGKHELASIIDYSVPSPGPTIRTAYFSGTDQDFYWSGTSTAFQLVQEAAWGVDFLGGYVTTEIKGYLEYVRCVRGGSMSTSFVDNHDGTITDNGSGLTWQQGEAEQGQMTWAQALTYCRDLTIGTRSNWRLPNIRELETLTSGYNPAISSTFFPNAHGTDAGDPYYWSSTTLASGTHSAARVVDFYWGGTTYRSKLGTEYVRCVQGGNDEPLVDLNISFLGSGSGTVSGSGVRNSSSVSFVADSATSEQFDHDSTVNLNGAPAEYSVFTGWSGDCGGIGDCELSMTAARDVTAVFDFHTAHKTKIGDNYYSNLQGACDAADPGEIIKAWATVYAESLSCALSDNVFLQGGYNEAYTSNTGMTTIEGHLTVHSYALTLENIVIR